MKISNLDAAVEISRALGHPARLRAVAMLRTGELCVCQITEVLQLAQSTVSSHLRELRRAGLITERKDGRWVYFALATDHEARSWLDVVLSTAGGDPQVEVTRRRSWSFVACRSRTCAGSDTRRPGRRQARRTATEPIPVKDEP